MSLMSCAMYTKSNPLWLQGITAKELVTKPFLAVLAFWGQYFCLHMTSYIYSTLLKYFIEELSPAERKQKDAGNARTVAGQQVFDVIRDVILRLSDT